MFLPSLLTPFILSALGLVGMIGTGIVIYALCLGIGWMDTHYCIIAMALVLLGLGWNFCLWVAPGYSTGVMRPLIDFGYFLSVNDLMVFGAQAIAALSAGCAEPSWVERDTGVVRPIAGRVDRRADNGWGER